MRLTGHASDTGLTGSAPTAERRASVRGQMHDLAIVLVSHSEAPWLRSCLVSVLAHTGGCAVDVVVVCNGNDGSAEIVEQDFTNVRAIRCENRGFAHACNTGLRTCDARYALLLNVDTEVRAGTFSDLVAALDERPSVGAAGVVQVTPTGEVHPTMRRFPTVLRALGEAFGSERWPLRPASFGEREFDRSRYESEQACDWMSGSFLVLRREALDDVGLLDERFFLYAEEPDLCLRLKQGGWEVRHLPVMTIVHHADRGSEDRRLEAQAAYARRQLAEKHFSPLRCRAFVAALALRYALRGAMPVGASRSAGKRRAARGALRVLLGIEPPPFASRPATSGDGGPS